MGGPQPLGYLENLIGEALRAQQAEQAQTNAFAGASGSAQTWPSLSSGTADELAEVTDILGLAGDMYPKWLDGALNLIGAGATAFDQYGDSTAKTIPGKLLDAGGAGGIDLAMGAVHPALPVVDMVVGTFFEEVLDIKGISIAEVEGTAIRAHTTLLEGLVTWDAEGMEDFHTRSLNGEYGPIFQKVSEFGEWAKPVTKVVIYPVVEVLRPLDMDAMVEQWKADNVAEAPRLDLSSREETGMKVTGVAYDTVPPPPPPEPDDCPPPRRR